MQQNQNSSSDDTSDESEEDESDSDEEVVTKKEEDGTNSKDDIIEKLGDLKVGNTSEDWTFYTNLKKLVDWTFASHQVIPDTFNVIKGSFKVRIRKYTSKLRIILFLVNLKIPSETYF